MKTLTEPIEEGIELLVDGELPEGFRAQLFGAIEETPDGWRRCALAFAEAQTLGESLSADGESSENPVASPRWWRFGGMAAAIVAAFFAGRVADRPASSSDAPVVAQQPAPAVAQRARPQVFRNTAALGGAPAYLTHVELPEFMLQALVSAGHRVRQSERKVHLDSPDGGDIELPLIETQIIDMRPLAL